MVKINKLKQVWEMRKTAKKMQSAMGEILITGKAAHGQVKMSVDGNQKVTNVAIDPAMMVPDNRERLQNAIVDAHENAQKQLRDIMAAKLRSGELKLDDLKI